MASKKPSSKTGKKQVTKKKGKASASLPPRPPAPVSTDGKKRRPGAFVNNDNRINRRGRPKKGETFTDIIRRRANRKDIRTKTGNLIKRKEAIIDKLFSKAIHEGDFPSAKYLIDRTDPPIGSEPTEEGGGGLAENVRRAIIAMIVRSTQGYPDVRKRIVKDLHDQGILQD